VTGLSIEVNAEKTVPDTEVTGLSIEVSAEKTVPDTEVTGLSIEVNAEKTVPREENNAAKTLQHTKDDPKELVQTELQEEDGDKFFLLSLSICNS
jgi:hypothetical protein